MFVWCDMCGYTAALKPGETIPEQTTCKPCDHAGMFTFLESGESFPDHVAPDEPLPIYPDES